MNKIEALDAAVKLAKIGIEANIEFFEIGNQSSSDRFYVSFYNEHALSILKHTALKPCLRPTVYNTYYFSYTDETTEQIPASTDESSGLMPNDLT